MQIQYICFLIVGIPDRLGEVIILDEEGYIDPLAKQIPNGYQFNPGRDYLLPVLQEQLALNSNLTQNPGWN